MSKPGDATVCQNRVWECPWGVKRASTGEHGGRAVPSRVMKSYPRRGSLTQGVTAPVGWGGYSQVWGFRA